MLRQEVGPVPVIAKPNCSESVVRKKTRDFLKVMVFLLTGVEFSKIDLLELWSYASCLAFPRSDRPRPEIGSSNFEPENLSLSTIISTGRDRCFWSPDVGF